MCGKSGEEWAEGRIVLDMNHHGLLLSVNP